MPEFLDPKNGLSSPVSLPFYEGLQPLDPLWVSPDKYPADMINFVAGFLKQSGINTDLNPDTVVPVYPEFLINLQSGPMHPIVSEWRSQNRRESRGPVSISKVESIDMIYVPQRLSLECPTIYAKPGYVRKYAKSYTNFPWPVSQKTAEYVVSGMIMHEDIHRNQPCTAYAMEAGLVKWAGIAILTTNQAIVKNLGLPPEAAIPLTERMMPETMSRGVMVFDGGLYYTVLDGYATGMYGYGLNEHLVDLITGFLSPSLMQSFLATYPTDSPHYIGLANVLGKIGDLKVGSSEKGPGKVEPKSGTRFLNSIGISNVAQLIRTVTHEPLIPRLIKRGGNIYDLPSTMSKENITRCLKVLKEV